MSSSLRYFIAIMTLLIGQYSHLHAEVMVLRNNLQEARVGDYIVVSTNKTNTLTLISGRHNQFLTIEEISIPEKRTPSQMNWKGWIYQNAPGNSSWVIYDLELQSGQITRYYSFTKRGWFNIPERDNFLSKLLNLKFMPIPDYQRKKVGLLSGAGPDGRRYWQPKMIFEGKQVNNVRFDAWKTTWPNDGSDMAGRTVEVFLPQENQLYPAYFPYWLQVSGVVGKARIRIIDSGRGLISPKAHFFDSIH